MVLKRNDQNFVTINSINDAVRKPLHLATSRVSWPGRTGVRMVKDAPDGLIQFVYKFRAETRLLRFVIRDSLNLIQFGNGEISISHLRFGNRSRSLANTSSPGTALRSPRSKASRRLSTSSAHNRRFLSLGGSKLSRSCCASRARVSTGRESNCSRMSSLVAIWVLPRSNCITRLERT